MLNMDEVSHSARSQESRAFLTSLQEIDRDRATQIGELYAHPETRTLAELLVSDPYRCGTVRAGRKSVERRATASLQPWWLTL
jgi:hypothetical protein